MPMSTHGNALAGSLAATLQAVEIQKLSSGDAKASIAGHETLFDALHQKHYLTSLGRNPACLFSHESCSIKAFRGLTLGDAFGASPGPIDRKKLSVPDKPFLSRLICGECDHEETVVRLRDSVARTCPICGKARPIRGFDLMDRLPGTGLTSDDLERPLSDLGIQAGEVFGVEREDHVTEYFVLDESKSDARPPSSKGVSVVVAGLGNIGSYLAPLLARLEGVAHVVLVDPDAYESGQQFGQDIPTSAFEKNKVVVQADRIRAIRPDLLVETFATSIERLPLGKLRNAIVVSCLDSRIARLSLAARAWRIGSPFVDAAVGGGSSLLVRTNVYIPGPDAACFECAFEASDYEKLEQIFPCDAESGRGAQSALVEKENENGNRESRLLAGSAIA
jgi:hypothetical protein